MTSPASWLTDDHCPACGADLHASDQAVMVVQECRSCGWSATWATSTPDGGSR
jgi:hypothetical protein